jgi:hypothetical protein
VLYRQPLQADGPSAAGRGQRSGDTACAGHRPRPWPLQGARVAAVERTKRFSGVCPPKESAAVMKSSRNGYLTTRPTDGPTGPAGPVDCWYPVLPPPPAPTVDHLPADAAEAAITLLANVIAKAALSRCNSARFRP